MIEAAWSCRFCGRSDVPDEQTAMTTGFMYALVQIQRLATPLLPEVEATRLNGIAVDGRDDSKSQQVADSGSRRAIVSNAVMSCITACMPARIDRNPASRNRLKAAVRSVVIAPAPLPRQRCASSWIWVTRIQC